MNNDFNVHTIETAPAEAKPLLEKSLAAWGMVPNLHAVLAEAPEVLNAYQQLHQSFMSTSLTSTEQHIVWLAISVENECHYCIPAHTMMAKMGKVPDDVITAVRNKTAINDKKLETLRSFTVSITHKRGLVDETELANFYAAGYTKQNILEVLLGVSQKILSNYSNHITHVAVDPPFEQFV